MDFVSHITKHIKGLTHVKSIDDDLIFTTKRDLAEIAHRFKYLYDVAICNQGYGTLYMQIYTDYGIVNIEIHRTR